MTHIHIYLFIWVEFKNPRVANIFTDTLQGNMGYPCNYG